MSDLTISTAPYAHPAMDYDYLREQGIQHLEQLAGHLWTDYNAHDPGITILEQVCYAITDLGHRINYPIPDIIASAGDEAAAGLFSAGAVLTMCPVTINDLRRLVIDVEGVKNAWVEPTPQAQRLYYNRNTRQLKLQRDDVGTEEVQLKGLYNVLIELSDALYVEGTAQSANVRRQVIERLHANRGICEDFVHIQRLKPQPVRIDARLAIASVDDAEQVLFEVYRALANHISPPVPSYTLSELLAQGKHVDEIYNGVMLQHGFILDEDLAHANRRLTLHTSDLIRAIMAVEGVNAVRAFRMATSTKTTRTAHAEAPRATETSRTPQEAWQLDLDPDLVPKLDLENSIIQFERNHLPINIDVQGVRNHYNNVIRREANKRALAKHERDIPIPTGKDRNIRHYTSIQHQFPDTYGISSFGLPASAPAERVAQARQLKAYLMFFDQLLANTFAQLAHAGELLSAAGSPRTTYFAQALDDPTLGLSELYSADELDTLTQAADRTAYDIDAQKKVNRRNRFLNHLLARFAERFTDYSLMLYGTVQANIADKLAQDKQRFLQNYPAISGGRGTGFNYLRPVTANNQSGLQQRIQYLLGLHDESEAFYMVEHILLRPMAGDDAQLVPMLDDPRYQDPYSLQVSFVFPSGAARFADDGYRQFVERTVRQETPAHLVPIIHWLNKADMTAFMDVYRTWIARRRSYWKTQLGVSS